MRFCPITMNNDEFSTLSERFIKKTFKSWTRPCVKGFKTIVIGDSMLRCFNKTRYKVSGHRITAFGGIELIELIVLLRLGRFEGGRKFDERETRENIENGKDSLSINKLCPKCRTDCTGKCYSEL